MPHWVVCVSPWLSPSRSGRGLSPTQTAAGHLSSLSLTFLPLSLPNKAENGQTNNLIKNIWQCCYTFMSMFVSKVVLATLISKFFTEDVPHNECTNPNLTSKT